MSLQDSSLITEIPIVRFQIEQVNFGLDVFQIRDIIRVSAITRVPNCSDYIIGVINLRGQIIPIVNLRKRLSFDKIEYRDDARILIVEYAGENAGLMVDSVSEVAMLSSNNIQPRPRYLVNNIDANYLVGLGLNEKASFLQSAEAGKSSMGEFILLLDVAKVLNLTKSTKEKSIIAKIVNRKAQLLGEEREKLRSEILQMKNKQKEAFGIGSTQKIKQMVAAKSDGTFEKRQQEIIDKIKKFQSQPLKLDVGDISSKKIKKLKKQSKNQRLQVGSTQGSVGKKKSGKVRRVVVKRRKKGITPPPSTPSGNFGKLNLSKTMMTSTELEEQSTVFEDMSEMELSLIQEIGNIGSGNAATALSNMVDKRVDISVPTVEICEMSKLAELLGGSEVLSIAIYIAVEGDISMYMMLVFDRPSALRLADNLLFQERSDAELNGTGPIGPMDESALQELGNILGSHYLTALSEFTGMHMIPGPPSLAYDMLGSIVDFIQIELEEQVDTALILNTDIMVAQQKIDGYILMLPIPESITRILRNMGL